MPTERSEVVPDKPKRLFRTTEDRAACTQMVVGLAGFLRRFRVAVAPIVRGTYPRHRMTKAIHVRSAEVNRGLFVSMKRGQNVLGPVVQRD
jgi:hypothetical protein